MRYAALLRAVNVGGRKVIMADLRTALTATSYDNVQSLQAAGSLVLETRKTAPAKLEATIEAVVLNCSGVASETMVRDPDEWSAIIAANPFPKDTKETPNFTFATMFKTPPDAALLEDYLASYRAKFGGKEKVKLIGREIYIAYPDGAGQSKLLLPKALGPGTARNWNTMLKLNAMLRA